MATVSAKIYSHHSRIDGTFNVKICVYHKKERKFFDTTHYLSQKQLTADFTIKDKFILKVIDDELLEHRSTISNLGIKLDSLSCEALRDYLSKKGKNIDFIAFSREHIAVLRSEKRNGSANNFRTVVNSLCDYFRRTSVPIEEINSNMLFSYEKWLKAPRSMVRINQLGKEVMSTQNGLKKGGLYNHLRDLRTLFNEAKRTYNNIDFGLILIKHYPFDTYKLGSSPKTQKRCHTIEQVRAIKTCKPKPGSRAELARDFYMLSFYSCGANACDFYNFLDLLKPKSKRWDYNRSKTSGQREDNAFFSVRILPEARKIINKYIGVLKVRYCAEDAFNTALSMGFRDLNKILGFKEITMYWARHSFANIARNKCGISKDDIGEALNHVNEEHKTTDIYLDRDWSIVDKVQEQVCLALQGKLSLVKSLETGYFEDGNYFEEINIERDTTVSEEYSNQKHKQFDEFVNYLLSIGYEKQRDNNSFGHLKLTKKIDEFQICSIAVYPGGELQMIGVPLLCSTESPKIPVESRSLFDTKVIKPNLSEFQIVERVMTRSQISYSPITSSRI
ncbi:site-specific integrase [Pedobacter cryoconitis]|uniref:Integrase-like protein n=1 Tax=Pedobacter cryoconitis TaxID=188932 RepID=A0A327THM7_9SPHI|nr:site-specific integrase [Pedobacter cryoconitis]RAJ37347.1 integrase-like protein [Pedobacter cryoconitis]